MSAPTIVPMSMLWSSAASLISEDQENSEYDRAIAELVTTLTGLSLDDTANVLAALRVMQQTDMLLTPYSAVVNGPVGRT